MINPFSDKAALGAMVLLAVALFALGGVAGATVTAWRKNAEIAALHTAAAQREAQLAEHASRGLMEAQTRGDALTRQLSAATRAASRLRKERDHALQLATTGRACLDGAALRVLDGAPGLRVDLPATAAGAAGADGAVATDTDLARWALDAGEQYEACRGRLGALIDFHEGAR